MCGQFSKGGLRIWGVLVNGVLVSGVRGLVREFSVYGGGGGLVKRGVLVEV